MVTKKTIQMYSDVDKAVVEWDVALETKKDEGGNEHAFVALRHNDELHKFSPNISDDELDRIINDEEGVRILPPSRK